MQAAEQPEVSGDGFWRWIGGLGIAFAILYTIGFFLPVNNGPDASSGGAAVVRFFSHEATMAAAETFVLAAGAIVIAFFLAALHRALDGSDGKHLALVPVIGGAVYIGGILFGALIQLGLVDAATAHQPGAAEALSLLSGDDWVPVVTGLAILGLGTGVAGLRQHRLPLWLTVPSIVIGLLAIAGPLGQIAVIATPLWALLLGVTLLVRPSLGRQRLVSTPVAQAV